MALNIAAISDLQAESGVLATVIKHPEFLANVNYMNPSYFYSVENGCIYWAVQKLYEEGIDNIDAFNLSNAISSNKAVKNKIEEYNIGNIQEFLELSRYAARDTLEEYKLLANNVVTLAFKRDLYKRSIDTQQMCLNGDADVIEINNKVNESMNELSTKYIIGSDTITFGEKARDVWNKICESRNPDGTVGFPSKIKAFNNYFTFCKKELVLLSARMKKGKSAYFTVETINLAIINKVPTLYIDTELSDETFMKRVLASLTGIEIKRIESGNYSDEEGVKIEKALQMIEESPLVHEYMPDGFNQAKVEALCHQWKNRLNIEFLVYDYMKYDDTESAYDAFNKLGSMCDFLKNKIAGKLDIAVLAGAQLNRQNEVGSSDKMEMYCSTSIRWFEKSAEQLAKDGLDCGNYGASIVLNRNGATTDENDYVDIRFDGSRMRISEAKRHANSSSPFDE